MKGSHEILGQRFDPGKEKYECYKGKESRVSGSTIDRRDSDELGGGGCRESKQEEQEKQPEKREEARGRETSGVGLSYRRRLFLFAGSASVITDTSQCVRYQWWSPNLHPGVSLYTGMCFCHHTQNHALRLVERKCASEGKTQPGMCFSDQTLDIVDCFNSALLAHPA